MSLSLGLLGLLAWRMGAQHFSHSEVFKRRILVLGAGRNASLINTALRRRSDRRAFTLLGFVRLPGQDSVVSSEHCLEAPRGLVDLANRCQAHEIVVAPGRARAADCRWTRCSPARRWASR